MFSQSGGVLVAGGAHESNITRDLLRVVRQHDVHSPGAQPYDVDLPKGAGKLGICLPLEVVFDLSQDDLGMGASQLLAASLRVGQDTRTLSSTMAPCRVCVCWVSMQTVSGTSAPFAQEALARQLLGR